MPLHVHLEEPVDERSCEAALLSLDEVLAREIALPSLIVIAEAGEHKLRPVGAEPKGELNSL